MEKKVLDFVLVPSGLLLMVVYHVWLFYRIMKHPTKTVIGINAINRRFWVQAMMEVCADVLFTMGVQKFRFLLLGFGQFQPLCFWVQTNIACM